MRVSLAASLLLLGIAACDPVIAAHVEPGSTADALVIHAFLRPDSARGTTRLSRLRVGRQPCDGGWQGEAMWEVEHRYGAGPAVRALFPYGHAPAGWSVTRAAQPLDSGCFFISAQGGGIGGFTHFRVYGDRKLEEIPDAAWPHPRLDSVP